MQTKEIQVERFSSHLPAATVSSLVGILMLTNGVFLAWSTWLGCLLPTIFYSVKLAMYSFWVNCIDFLMTYILYVLTHVCTYLYQLFLCFSKTKKNFCIQTILDMGRSETQLVRSIVISPALPWSNIINC